MAAKPEGPLREAVAHRVAAIWWAILLRGVLAVALGACALIWPQKTIDILVKVLGVYFLFDGVTGAVSAYRSQARGMQYIPPVMSLALGLVLLLWTDVSAKIFLILTGVWLVVQGIGVFLTGRQIKTETGEGTLAMAVSAIMVLVGCVFIFWTDTGMVAVSWLLGIGAGLIGVALIYLATRLKRLRQRLAG